LADARRGRAGRRPAWHGRCSSQGGGQMSTVSNEALVSLYRTMRLARAVDERLWILNRQGKVPFTVSCQGHEAIGAALAHVLRPGHDWVAPYFRDLALVLGLGASVEDVFLHALA